MTKILMYHSIGVSNNGEIGAGLYSVPVKNFKQQMEYIAEKIRTEEQEKKDHRPSAIDCRPVVITFDDGLLDNYTNAYPILREFGLKAYFFILVGRIGAPGYMNWEKIRELHSAGMIIGSHGIKHKILTGLSDGELSNEIVKSKRFLEDNLMQSVDYFSVPRGFYNKKIIAIAKQAGYKAIFTSNPEDTDGFKFWRIPVKSSWDLEYFIRVVGNGFSSKDKVEALIKSSSKKILGVKNYDRLRTMILKK